MINHGVPKYLNLKEDEELVALVHPTFFAFTGSILGALFFLFLAFFFVYPLFSLGIWGIILFLALLAAAKYFLIRIGIGRYGNMYVVTSERLIDVERRGIFDRIVSELPLNNIHDISFRTQGPLGMLLRIGTITVRTIGGATNFAWRWVRNPEEVRDLMTEIQRLRYGGAALEIEGLQSEQKKILLSAYINKLSPDSLSELHHYAEELLDKEKDKRF